MANKAANELVDANIGEVRLAVIGGYNPSTGKNERLNLNSGALQASVEIDNVGLATESSLTSDQPRSIQDPTNGSGNVQTVVEQQNAGLAQESSLTSEQNRAISSPTDGSGFVQTALETQSAGLAQESSLTSTQDRNITDINNTGVASASTTAAGSASAAQVTLGDLRSGVDVFYDVANDNGDIVVEIRLSGGTWREWARVQSGNISASGESAFAVQGDTVYPEARAYASSGFADADVNVVEVVAGWS